MSRQQQDTLEQELWNLLGMNYQPEKAMQKSESIAALAAALAKAQGSMASAKKDANNPFFKSKYADLASVVDAIREPFSTNGLSYVQLTEPSDKDEVRVTTMLMHESGEWMNSTLAVPVTKADAQGYGSALTYTRRYGLQAIAGLAADDDDGNAAAKATSAKSVTLDVWDSLAPQKQYWLQGIADSVRAELEEKGGAAALVMLEAKGLDADHKVAIWSRFDSKERTAMKPPVSRVRNEKATAAA